MFMIMLLSQTLSVHMCDDIGSQVKGPQRAAHMLCIRYMGAFCWHEESRLQQELRSFKALLTRIRSLSPKLC